MEILGNLATGFAVALTPINLLYCFLGSFVGTAIGVLPGLGPPATIALLLPVTYGIPATSAVILLAGIFYGAMYGGSTTSILLNIPGEAASVVTCLDGYQMARQGRAGAALAISAFGSFIAGTLSIVGLMLLAPPLASFAIRFGPPENFALLVLGLTMVGYLAGGSMTKGLLVACIGLLLGTVGLDPIMGTQRFTYGVFKLSEGFEFILVAMGLFGIGEVLVNVEQNVKAEVFQTTIRGLLPNREEWRTSAAPIARGSLLGFLSVCCRAAARLSRPSFPTRSRRDLANIPSALARAPSREWRRRNLQITVPRPARSSRCSRLGFRAMPRSR